MRSLIKRILRRFKPAAPSLILKDRPDLADHDIGDWSYGGVSVLRWNKNGKLKIGKFCSFAGGTTILLGGEHRLDVPTTYPLGVFMDGVDADAHEQTKGDIVIGDDVWVGRGATIMSGVTIGAGAVIGAQSLVTKDVPPYAIACGNPAKVLRFRFDDDTIARLLDLKWWDWPVEKIRKEAPSLLTGDIETFIERHSAQTEKR